MWGRPAAGYPTREEVLSMRLGKEQAVGYVEDTEAEVVAAEEVPVARAGGLPLAAATEAPLTVG